jgi:Fe2+ or Zn2+ uptake regulation protein
MKISVLAVILVGALPVLGQHDHSAEMNARGAQVMGFSQEKTTHHFVLTFDGGVIDVRANDVKDIASRDEIRMHFQHIAHSFAAGDFTDPMLVHATKVPGTAAMEQLKDALHWNVVETQGGAKMVVTADNKPALDALHEFLKFQIEDHHTGDCEVPH